MTTLDGLIARWRGQAGRYDRGGVGAADLANACSENASSVLGRHEAVRGRGARRTAPLTGYAWQCYVLGVLTDRLNGGMLARRSFYLLGELLHV